MIRAMGTAASGMKAQQLNIDTIANNLANVNTTGFKKAHAEFQDLLYEKVMPGGQVDAQGRAVPTRVEIGHGVKLVSTNKSSSQGTVRSNVESLVKVVDALSREGVELISEGVVSGGGGRGVRLKNVPAEIS